MCSILTEAAPDSVLAAGPAPAVAVCAGEEGGARGGAFGFAATPFGFVAPPPGVDRADGEEGGEEGEEDGCGREWSRASMGLTGLIVDSMEPPVLR